MPDYDTLPIAEPIRNNEDLRRRHYPNNDIGQVYNRLRRWLRSRVGQKVDDVFSEWVKLDWIPKRFRNRDGFDRYVELTTMKDGKKVLFAGWSGKFQDIRQCRRIFYVHPEKRTLRYQETSLPKNKKEAPVEFIYLEDGLQLRLLDGIWYEVSFKLSYQVKVFYRERCQMQWVTCTVAPDKPLNFKRDGKAVLYKRQLSHCQLKKLNLSNQA